MRCFGTLKGLEEPPLGLFCISQALYLLGWPYVQHYGWSSKFSLQRKTQPGGVNAGKADVMFSPHVLIMFRDISTCCRNSPVFFCVGARTRTEPASKFAHVEHPLRSMRWEPSLHGKEMKEEGGPLCL